MIRQYIDVGDRKWGILVYYNVRPRDLDELEEVLIELDCPEKDMNRALGVVERKKNTGFTFSNTEDKMSIVCISAATSPSQFVHTAVHEAKHVQSHICSYYGVDENSEEAAYLIGDIVQKMYKKIVKIIHKYVRFTSR